ncbi:thioesterase family protein [Biformimicrobium ophioploci]|uniref:Medium/long-chain acyl-CoA thioesterase YigI n=1 Tax=Biformimicrobium ophioploci TaxID=3036711 RepID=A0ABQ6M1L7_9GAMM|nr:thioesterase family protein [Microbulbifer sp. NKW57]GMG88182.1 thioesterase family protein [Microbulbifer sp. NKW57]
MTEPSPDELRALIGKAFNDIPFNKHIGLALEDIESDTLSARFEFKPELVGNVWQKILHGGVTASVLDAVGGMTAMYAAYMRLGDISWQEKVKRLGKLGTIDMRIDYLKPGRGEWFRGVGSILRTGNKLVVTRMELSNSEGELIAVGTATYLY